MAERGIKDAIVDILERKPLRHKLASKYVLVKNRIKRDISCIERSIDTSSTTNVKRALIIGINYTGSRNALAGCINDAKDIMDMLIEHYKFDENNIVLLIDKKRHHMQPTRENILFWIRKLVKETKAGDELFVHYSGHGTQVKCTCGDEDTNDITPGMDDVIIPCDFESKYGGRTGFITDDILRIELVQPLPEGAKLRAFFDCCCSGTALDLPYVYKNAERYELQYDAKLKCKDCLLISGCRDDQSSADAYLDCRFNGALTWGLKMSLSASRDMDMTWKDLLFLVRHYLIEKGYDQIPVLSVGSVEVAKMKVTL
ncbi:MAG: caspase family protein [Methylococcales bacterium]|nr:caspase family protein [Methylococcales bacterium]